MATTESPVVLSADSPSLSESGYKKSLPAFVDHRPLYLHDMEDGRTVCMVYDYDREKGELRYGAAIHKKIVSKDTFCKKDHRDTAIGRLEKCPVIVPDFEDSTDIKEFNQRLQDLVTKHWQVRGKRIKNAA